MSVVGKYSYKPSRDNRRRCKAAALAKRFVLFFQKT
jgi:hypothetical protein